MTLIHINIPKIEDIKLKRLDCPTCQKNRFMVFYLEEWYGGTVVCLRCGERWQDGEMCPRPFVRGWRKQAVADIKAVYRRCIALAKKIAK